MDSDTQRISNDGDNIAEIFEAFQNHLTKEQNTREVWFNNLQLHDCRESLTTQTHWLSQWPESVCQSSAS